MLTDLGTLSSAIENVLLHADIQRLRPLLVDPESRAEEREEDRAASTGQPTVVQIPSASPSLSGLTTTPVHRAKHNFISIRPCYMITVFMFSTILSSGTFAVYWTVHANAMGDAFTAASWFAAVGTLIVAVPVARHYPRCKYWKRNVRTHLMIEDTSDMVQLGRVDSSQTNVHLLR